MSQARVCMCVRERPVSFYIFCMPEKYVLFESEEGVCDVKPRQARLWSKFRLLSGGSGQLTVLVITSDGLAQTLARYPQDTVGKYIQWVTTGFLLQESGPV